MRFLSIFVDTMLSVSAPTRGGRFTGGEAPSSEAYLFSYLRMLETQGEKLPATFVDALRRVLAHYGVETLDRSPALEESLLWIYKSHQRVGQQITTILAVLERRLGRVETPSPSGLDGRRNPFRTLLDRMISITRGLFPAVSDLAREVRYRCFDQPLFSQARKQIYEEMEDHLAYLAADLKERTATRESANWWSVHSRW